MEYVAVLLPSVVVGLIFWFAMKAIFNADKSERQAEARAQAEADARAAQAGNGPAREIPPTEVQSTDRPDPEAK
ncbi:hypothetical protein [Arthrobacter sp. AD-310]